MSTVESLFEQNWNPRRSVVLAFGFDEETGGVRGAAKIAEGEVFLCSEAASLGKDEIH